MLRKQIVTQEIFLVDTFYYALDYKNISEDDFRIEVWGEVEEETLIKNANLEFFNNLVKILSMI